MSDIRKIHISGVNCLPLIFMFACDYFLPQIIVSISRECYLICILSENRKKIKFKRREKYCTSLKGSNLQKQNKK